MTQEQLLNIPLGESVVNGRWDILRVIGGWVYSQLFYEHNGLCGADLVINSSLTSIFVPEPKPVVSRFIQLTNNSGRKICINIDKIASMYPSQETGTAILFDGDNDYYDNVKESYDEVMAMIQAREGTK